MYLKKKISTLIICIIFAFLMQNTYAIDEDENSTTRRNTRYSSSTSTTSRTTTKTTTTSSRAYPTNETNSQNSPQISDQNDNSILNPSKPSGFSLPHLNITSIADTENAKNSTSTAKKENTKESKDSSDKTKSSAKEEEEEGLIGGLSRSTLTHVIIDVSICLLLCIVFCIVFYRYTKKAKLDNERLVYVRDAERLENNVKPLTSLNHYGYLEEGGEGPQIQEEADTTISSVTDEEEDDDNEENIYKDLASINLVNHSIKPSNMLNPTRSYSNSGGSSNESHLLRNSSFYSHKPIDNIVNSFIKNNSSETMPSTPNSMNSMNTLIMSSSPVSGGNLSNGAGTNKLYKASPRSSFFPLTPITPITPLTPVTPITPITTAGNNVNQSYLSSSSLSSMTYTTPMPMTGNVKASKVGSGLKPKNGSSGNGGNMDINQMYSSTNIQTPSQAVYSTAVSNVELVRPGNLPAIESKIKRSPYMDEVSSPYVEAYRESKSPYLDNMNVNKNAFIENTNINKSPYSDNLNGSRSPYVEKVIKRNSFIIENPNSPYMENCQVNQTTYVERSPYMETTTYVESVKSPYLENCKINKTTTYVESVKSPYMENNNINNNPYEESNPKSPYLNHNTYLENVNYVESVANNRNSYVDNNNYSPYRDNTKININNKYGNSRNSIAESYKGNRNSRALSYIDTQSLKNYNNKNAYLSDSRSMKSPYQSLKSPFTSERSLKSPYHSDAKSIKSPYHSDARSIKSMIVEQVVNALEEESSDDSSSQYSDFEGNKDKMITFGGDGNDDDFLSDNLEPSTYFSSIKGKRSRTNLNMMEEPATYINLSQQSQNELEEQIKMNQIQIQKNQLQIKMNQQQIANQNQKIVQQLVHSTSRTSIISKKGSCGYLTQPTPEKIKYVNNNNNNNNNNSSRKDSPVSQDSMESISTISVDAVANPINKSITLNNNDVVTTTTTTTTTVQTTSTILQNTPNNEYEGSPDESERDNILNDYSLNSSDIVINSPIVDADDDEVKVFDVEEDEELEEDEENIHNYSEDIKKPAIEDYEKSIFFNSPRPVVRNEDGVEMESSYLMEYLNDIENEKPSDIQKKHVSVSSVSSATMEIKRISINSLTNTYDIDIIEQSVINKSAYENQNSNNYLKLKNEQYSKISENNFISN